MTVPSRVVSAGPMASARVPVVRSERTCILARRFDTSVITLSLIFSQVAPEPAVLPLLLVVVRKYYLLFIQVHMTLVTNMRVLYNSSFSFSVVLGRLSRKVDHATSNHVLLGQVY